VLSDKAARLVRRRATIIGTRYTKDEANKTASAILEAQDRMLYITEDMIAALPVLEAARQQSSGTEERGLAQIVAALWVVSNAER